MTAPVDALPRGNASLQTSNSLQKEAWTAPGSESIPGVVTPQSGAVRWQWDHKKGWRDYDPRTTRKIEAAFQNGHAFVRVKSGKDNGTPMELFFAEMVQIDRKTGNRRLIQRLGPNPLHHRAARRLKIIAKFIEFGRQTPASRKLLTQGEGEDGSKKDGSRDAPGHKDEEHEHKDAYHNGCCGNLARSITFYAFSVLMVLFNVCWLGYEANYNEATSLYKAKLRYIIMENVFCAFFSIELLIRFCAYRRKCDSLKDYWFDFDLCLVILAVGECYVLPLFLWMFTVDPAGRGGWAIFRFCRLMKVARLGRAARLIRHFPQMMILARGIFEALRAVLYTTVLLAGLLYVFGIIFKTQVAGTNETLTSLFPTVQGTMWLLLLEGILLDGPKDTLNTLREESVILTTTFLVFTVFSAFLVMNMLIGIVCNVVDHVSSSEEELAKDGFLRNTLLELLDCYDKDGDQMLTRTEFEFLMQNPEMNLILDQLGVDQSDLLSLKEVMFDDSDNNWKLQKDIAVENWGTGTESVVRYKELSFQEFISLVFRLRGVNAVKVGDLVELREFVKQRLDKNKVFIKQRLDELEEHLGMRDRPRSRMEGAQLPLRMAAANGTWESPPLPPDRGAPNPANGSSLREQLAGISASQQTLEARQQAIEETMEARMDLLTTQVGTISSQLTWLCETLGKSP